MSQPALKHIIEGLLLAHGAPMSVERMLDLFSEDARPFTRKQIEAALAELNDDLAGRGIELVKVASGYRMQVRQNTMPWVSRLWDEKPPRYTRALLETLALIAYRQPVTRGDIEDVRGVVVSTNIIKTLMEREWIRVVGYRDVPGRPAMYATTATFLDYFGLRSLDELPTLAEIRDLDEANRALELGDDANPRRVVDEDYGFDGPSDHQTEEDVLASTEDDLATASALVDQVEHNLFGERDDSSDSGRKQFGDLIRKLEGQGADPGKVNPDLPPEQPDAESAVDDSDS